MSTIGPLAAHAAPYLKLVLPSKFYNVPVDAPALFSTRNGTKAKRQLCSPPSAPIVRSDFDQEVKRMAAVLRKELPQVAGLIRNPTTWKDLYYFFDAVDLWVEGAVFLYYVVSHISKDNEIASEAYTRMNQNAMIFQYASNWVANNAGQIMTLAPETDFTTLFNQFQKGDICGLRDYELETMKQALRFHHARLREKYGTIVPVHGVDAAQQPASHPAHSVQQGLASAMQHDQPMDSQPGPIVGRKDQNHHKIVPVHPITHPPPQTYSHFMEAQRTITGALTSSPTARGHFKKDNNDIQRGPRAREYSGDAGRNGHSLPKGRLSHGNDNHMGVNDQRVVDSAFHRSPPRPAPYTNQPIYVHNSQYVSPPHGRETAVNTRTFYKSQTGRTGAINDARVWSDSSQFPRRQSQSSQESLEKPVPGPQSTGCHQRSGFIPFEGHPDARITDKSCTFYYQREYMDQKPDFYNNRTLYVYGAPVEMFSSHTLKDMMSEVGTVESISYLYSNPLIGPAFITFTEERALPPAIARFNGLTTATGHWMEVKLPDKYRTSRDRSGSQSSQTFYPSHNSNYPVRRNNRNPRKNSTSSRQYNRPHRTGDDVKSQDNSPEAHRYQSGNRSPLTSSFQSQLCVSPPFSAPAQVENFHSSISEIMQHQSAMERLRLAQMPLEPIINYSGGNRKSDGPFYEKSRWNKENSPVKDDHKNTALVVTPKKEHAGIYSVENSNNANKVKENNGLMQNTSHFNASDITPVKSHSIIDLVEVLRASVRQKSPAVSLNSSGLKDEPKFFNNSPLKEPKPTLVQNTSTVSLTIESVLDHTVAKLGIQTPMEVVTSTLTIGNRELSPQSEDAPKSRKPKKNKHKQANFRREASSSSEATAATSTASVDTSSPTLTDTTDYKSATTSFSEASSRNHSFTSAKSTVSLSTTNDSFIEQDLQSTPTPVNKYPTAGSSSSSSGFPTPKPPKSRHQYRSRDSKKMSPSELYNDAYRTANSNSGVSDGKKLGGEILEPISPDIMCSDGANGIDDPITSLQDPKQWPALERTKTGSSRITDGKPPVIANLSPITVHNTSASTKNPIAIVPALPLNMIPHRRNSGESQAWPRVRKCVGK